MKKRIFSAIVGLLLLVAVMFFYHTPLLPAVLALLSAIGVYEMLVAPHYLPSRLGGLLCAVYAGASIFVIAYFKTAFFFFLALFWAALIVYTLLSRRSFSFQQMAVCAFIVLAIPLSFSLLLQMPMEPDGRIYLLLTCVGAWVTDTSAFFIGRAFGKRKLAPRISPNKTIEGAIGGIVSTGIFFPLTCYIYCWLASLQADVSLVRAILIGLFCAFSGIIGDLFASLIKRENNIKDFGKIMPGHGGVMDRFDSFLFVAPALYFLNSLFPIFIF